MFFIFIPVVLLTLNVLSHGQIYGNFSPYGLEEDQKGFWIQRYVFRRLLGLLKGKELWSAFPLSWGRRGRGNSQLTCYLILQGPASQEAGSSSMSCVSCLVDV
jgi:hypothetical protein